MDRDYDKLAHELETTANHVQFVEVLKRILNLEYSKGFDRGYMLGKNISKQNY